MQSSADVTRQIAQVQREVQDITCSLDRLTDIQDLLGAKAELRDRTDVLDLLTTRLADAEKRETTQAERA